MELEYLQVQKLRPTKTHCLSQHGSFGGMKILGTTVRRICCSAKRTCIENQNFFHKCMQVRGLLYTTQLEQPSNLIEQPTKHCEVRGIDIFSRLFK